MSDFTVPYTKHDDIMASAFIYCMKCHKEIAGPTYKEMPKKNAPKEKVLVYARHKHSNYRQVGVAIEKSGLESKTYLPVCVDCIQFQLTDEVKPLIEKQIKDAYFSEVEWTGMSPIITGGMETIKVLRRL